MSFHRIVGANISGDKQSLVIISVEIKSPAMNWPVVKSLSANSVCQTRQMCVVSKVIYILKHSLYLRQREKWVKVLSDFTM
jgi:hypothetical protein